jgi:hypothetical protein
MKAPYFCYEKSAVHQSIFIKTDQYGDIELYSLKKYADDDHFGLFFLNDDGFMCPARFTRSQIPRIEADGYPKDKPMFLVAQQKSIRENRSLLDLINWCAFGLPETEWRDRKAATLRRHRAQRKERIAKDLAKSLKFEKDRLEWLELTTNLVAQNVEIDGDEVVDLSNHYSIDIHPRTKGVLRSHVQHINESTCTVSTNRKGRKPSTDLCFEAYRALRNHVLSLENKAA